jgi:hypothetical protein
LYLLFGYIWFGLVLVTFLWREEQGNIIHQQIIKMSIWAYGEEQTTIIKEPKT